MSRPRPTTPQSEPAGGAAPEPPRHRWVPARPRPTRRAVARSAVVLALAGALLAPAPATAQQDDPPPDDQTADGPESTEPENNEPETPTETPPAAPVFNDGASVTLTIGEGHADGASVGIVAATDANSDTLTYSLSGADAASFALDPATGEITVASGVTLDFETQASHSVTVEVSDGNDADGNPEDTPAIDATIEVTIEVTEAPEDEQGETGDEGEPENEGEPADEGEVGEPEVTAPAAPVFNDGASVTLIIAEDHADGASVGIVAATDADGDTLIYSLSGPDAASFALDPATGEITVASGVTLDFETQASHSVTVEVSDGNDADGNPEDTPAIDATIEVTIEVTDAPEDQAGADEETGNDAADGALGQFNQGAQDGARNAQSDGPAGAQQSNLPIGCHADGTETGDWFQSVTATATLIFLEWTDPQPADLERGTSGITVCAPTGALDEDSNPIFASHATFYSVNLDVGVFSIFSYSGTTSDLLLPDTEYWWRPQTGYSANQKVWKHFKVRTQAGTATPPLGCGGRVEGSDAVGNLNNQAITSLSAAGQTIKVGFEYKADLLPASVSLDLCNGAGEIATIDSDITRSGTDRVVAGEVTITTADFTNNSTDDPTSLAANTDYWVRTKVGTGYAWHYIRTESSEPADPVFTDGASTTLTVAEDLAAGGSVGTVGATDANSDTLVYSLTGTDASSFVIDNSTGEISLLAGATLDYETKSSYSVTVGVKDNKDSSGNDAPSEGNDATIAVTITVTNVEEPPGAPTSVSVDAPSRTETSLTVTWTAPSDSGALAVSDYDVRYFAGTSDPGNPANWIEPGESGGHDHVGTMTTTTITGLAPNTAYRIQVRAEGDGEGAWSSSASGTTTPNSVTLSWSPSSAAEPATATDVSVKVTATIAAARNANTTVNLEFAGGTATAGAGNDYTLTGAPTSVTIPANQTSVTSAAFTLQLLPDNVDEGTGETVVVRLMGTHWATINEGTFTILEQPQITLSLEDGSGNALSSLGEAADSTQVTVKASRDTAKSSGAVTVNLALDSSSTAMHGTDYTGTSNLGTISLGANEASATKTINIDPQDDLDADSETIVIGGTATGHTVSTATLTLNDDDTPSDTITLSVNPVSVSETTGAKTVRVGATVNGAAVTADTTVTLSLDETNSTATKGTDYTDPGTLGTIILATGLTLNSKTITITPTADTLDEGVGETIVITGTITGNSAITTVNDATLTITDNDPTPTTINLKATPESVNEADAGTAKTITVKAAFEGASTRTVDTVVSLGSIGGTATAGTGNDYTLSTALSGSSITIPAGASESTANVTFGVTPLQDTDSEGPETITLGGEACLSTPMMGADCPDADVLTVNDAVVTLTDDDLPVIMLSLSPTSLSEQAGQAPVRVTATRDSSAASAAVNVVLSLHSSSTAVSGTDYTGLTNLPTITLGAGATSGFTTVRFDPTEDADAISETIVFDATAAGYSVSRATFTINDQDTAATSVTITAKTAGNATQIAESAGATTVTVTATLDGATLGDNVTVTFNAVGGTATRGASDDYTLTDADDNALTKPATITISSGSKSAQTTVKITPRNDTFDEGTDETIVFDATLSGGLTGTGAGKVTPATFKIRDNDTLPSSIDLTVDTDSVAGGDQSDIDEGAVGDANGDVSVKVTATIPGSATRTAATAVSVMIQTVAQNGATPSADGTSGDYQVKTFNGGAPSGVTFPISLGNITIPAGAGSANATFKINPRDDSTSEGTETIRLGGSAASFTVNRADISLIDNDDPPLTLASSTTTVGEGGGATQVTVTAAVGANVTGAVTVPLTFTGAAAKGTDYAVTSPASPSVTIPSGTKTGSVTFTITPTDDRLTEGDEKIVIGGTHDDYDVGTHEITLTDDDMASTLVLLKLSTDTVDDLRQLGEAADETTVTVTAELNDGTLGSPVTVTFADLSGTATRGTDYTAKNASNTDVTKPATLTIASGSVEASTTIKINPTDDDIDEGNERIDFTATLTGALTGSATDVALSIGDNDTALKIIHLAVSPEKVSEGHTGEETITVTAALQPNTATFPTDTVVAVNIVETPAGTSAATPSATSSSGDYTLKNFAGTAVTDVTLSSTQSISLGSITIPAATDRATATFKIDPRDDSIFEGTEDDAHEYIRIGGVLSNFIVNATNLEITENDKPVISLSVDADPNTGGTQRSVSEGAGTRNLSVTMTLLEGARRTPIAVAINFTGSTATRGACSTAGNDFSASTVTKTIPANQASSTFALPVTVCDDKITETAAENIAIGGTATGFDVTGTLVPIDDNDVASTSLTITATPSPLAEKDGSRAVTVTATLDGGTLPSDNVTVTFAALAGSATSGASADYTSNPAKPAEIMIASGSLSASTTISIDPNDDSIDEVDETIEFGATAVKSGGGNLTVTAGTVTITDDDTAAVTIGVDTNAGQTGTPTSIGEGAGATTVRVSATLSTTRSTATEVTLSIDGGSADRGSDKDYTASASLTDTTVDITIAAGSTSVTADVTITPIDDRFDDDDETIVIGASATDSLAVTAGTVTITDNDDPSTTVALTVDTDTAAMGNQHNIGEGAGATSVAVTATLNDAVRDAATTVTLTFAGTATRGAGSDYASGGDVSVTILANEVSGTATVTITPTDEKIDDGDKTITIGGTPPSSSGLSVTSASDITLADNDDAPTAITLTVTPTSVREQGPAGQNTLDTEVTVKAAFTGTNSDVTLLTDTLVTLSIHGDGTAQRNTSATKPTTWNTGDQYWAPATLGDGGADITIGKGETEATATFTFTSRNENINDGDKTIIIDATANNSFTVAATDRATIDFTDNDGASTSLTLTVYEVAYVDGEGRNRYFPVGTIQEGVTTAGQPGHDVYIVAELDGAASTSAITVTLDILDPLTALDATNCPGAEVGQYCDGRTPARPGPAADYTAPDSLTDTTVDITIPANQTSSAPLDTENEGLITPAGPFRLVPLVDLVDDGGPDLGASGNEIIRIGGTASDASITTVNHVDIEILDNETASTTITLSRAGPEGINEDHGAGVAYQIDATLGGNIARSVDTPVTLGFEGSASVGSACAADSASETIDYTVSPSPAVITIPADVRIGTLSNVILTPCDDEDSEGNETIEVRGTADFGGSTGVLAVVSGFDVSLVDDELPVVTVTSTRVSPASDEPGADSSVQEGETATFRITASRLVARNASRVELPLSVQADQSSATPGDDYQALAANLGTIIIPADEAEASRTVTVRVRTIEDRVRESGGETIVIGGQIGDGTEYSVTPATLTIADDDGPSDGFELSVNRRSVSEAAGPTEVTVTAEVNMGAPTSEVTVTLSFGGVATAGTDYTVPGTVTLTIPANELKGSVTFEIDPTEDLLDEGRGEAIEIGVASATGLEAALDQTKVTPAELTITDNDTASNVVTLSADEEEIDEPAEDATPAATTVTITARLGNPTETDPVLRGDPVDVTLELGGTATDDVDYTVTYGTGVTVTSDGPPTIQIPAETLSTTATLAITPKKDRIDEGTRETIVLGGTAVARDVRLRLNRATINLTDNDDPSTRVTLSASSGSGVAETDGPVEMTVTAVLDDAARRSDTVVWLELGGTAAAGDDYRVLAPDPVLVKIPAWVAEGTATFVIDPLDDAIDEPAAAETITVSSRDARVSGLEVWHVGGTEDDKRPSLATGITITDNDTASTAIALTVDTARLREAGSSAAVRVTATLSGAVARSDDTEVALTALPEDPAGYRHRGLPESVTIGAGSLSGTATGLRITPVQDDDTNDETITLAGTSAGFTVSPATITVVDDDSPSTSLTLSVSPVSLRESNTTRTVRVTATLDGGTLETTTNVNLTFDVANSTATRAADPANPAVGDDYSGLPAVGDAFPDITIEEGRTSGTSDPFSIELLDDMVDEGDETILLSGTVIPASITTVHGATLTIADNDTASGIVELSADVDTIAEDAGAAESVTVTAALVGDIARNVETVVALSLGGTAESGSTNDYTRTGTLSITIGARQLTGSTTLMITPRDDTAREGTETIEIEGAAAGMTVRGATVSVTDNDVAVPAPPEVHKPVRRPTTAALRWTAPEAPDDGTPAPPPPDGYLVQRRSSGGRWQDVTVIRANPDTYSYNDGPLDRTTAYQWRVLSFVDAAETDPVERFAAVPAATEVADPTSSFVGGGPSGGGPSGGGPGAGEDAPADTAERGLARSAAARFADIDIDDYYAAAVGWMLAHEITAGCARDSFCAHDPATRRHFVTFLWRAAGSPVPAQPGSEVFADVDAGDYADNAIGWALEQGVTTGCGADDDGGLLFCPDDPATRAQISTFIHRYTGAEQEPGDTFADVDPGSYFAAPVAWMHAHGITTGCGADDDGGLLFCPGEPATRAHVAVFLYRTATTPQSWRTNGGILKPAPQS